MALNVGGIEASMMIDMRELDTKLDLIDSLLKDTDTKLQNVISTSKKFQTSTEGSAQSVNQLGTESKETAKDLNKIDSAAKDTASGLSKVDREAQQAGQGLEEMATGVDALDEVFNTISTGGLGLVVTVLTTITGLTVGAGFGVLALGDDFKSASNQMAAATDVSIPRLEMLNEVLRTVYTDNFGEGYMDVADAIALVDQQLGGLSQADLTTVTEGMFALRDVFDIELNESIQGVDRLMGEFGISADEALALMIQGAQNGLNVNEDLAEQISEYGSLWADAGFSAEEMFNMLVNGVDEGVYQLDFLNDAIKEFGVRTKDNSDTVGNAFEQLGFNADEMFQRFAAGDETSKDAFVELNNALFELDDNVLRNELGVALWGTKWEDLGEDAIYALTNTNGEIELTAEALEALNDIKYDNLFSNLENLKRLFVDAITGGEIDTEQFTEVIESIVDNITETLETALPNIHYLMYVVLPQLFRDGLSAVNDEIEAFLDDPEFFNIEDNIIEGIEITPELINEITEFLDNIGQLFTIGFAQFLKVAGPMATAFTEALPDIIIAVNDLVTEISDGIGEALEDEENKQALTDAAVILFGTLTENAQTIYDEAIAPLPQAILNELGNDLRENPDAVVQGLGQGLMSALTPANIIFGANFSIASQLGEIGGQIIVQIMAGIMAELKGFGTRVGIAIAAELAMVKLKIRLKVKEIKNDLDGWVDDFEQAGKDWVQGIINGMLSKLGYLRTIAAQIAGAAIGGTSGKDGFDSHSPSKKGIQQGEFYGEGVALGIKNMIPKVRMAGVDIAGGSMNSAGATMSASGGGSSITIINQGTVVGSNGMQEFSDAVSRAIARDFSLGPGGALI